MHFIKNAPIFVSKLIFKTKKKTILRQFAVTIQVLKSQKTLLQEKFFCLPARTGHRPQTKKIRKSVHFLKPPFVFSFQKMCQIFELNKFFQYNQSYYDEQFLPNFTPCFQHTILTWIPIIFFYSLSPILYFQLKLYQKHQRFRPLPWQNLLIIKFVSLFFKFYD